MKEISVVVTRISEILIGFPQESIEAILPITYDTKRSLSVYMKTKNVKKVWGYATSFQYEGKNIKIIDLSLLWKLDTGFHKFKYVLVCNGWAIRVDDIIEIEDLYFKELYLFPLYLQKLLNLKYIWGIARKKRNCVYLIDPVLFKEYAEGIYGKGF